MDPDLRLLEWIEIASVFSIDLPTDKTKTEVVEKRIGLVKGLGGRHAIVLEFMHPQHMF